MKLYQFEANLEASLKPTPTVIAFIKSMMKMTKEDQKIFSGEQVMKYAVDHNLWSTKQVEDKWMTTWAFYVKRLKYAGLKEVGFSGGPKATILMKDLVETDEE